LLLAIEKNPFHINSFACLLTAIQIGVVVRARELSSDLNSFKNHYVKLLEEVKKNHSLTLDNPMSKTHLFSETKIFINCVVTAAAMLYV
jgi:hypothetical protein